MVGLRFGEIGKPVMATSMTHLAPSTWRGFCLATPVPSAGSPPMPVGCLAVTHGGCYVRYFGGWGPRAARGEGELRSDEALRLPDRARAVENRPRLRGGWRDWVR